MRALLLALCLAACGQEATVPPPKLDEPTAEPSALWTTEPPPAPCADGYHAAPIFEGGEPFTCEPDAP